MPISAKYAFVVSMDVDPAYEDLFNEVYDTEHVPYLLEVDGVHAVNRMKGQAFQMAMAGEISEKPAPSPSSTPMIESSLGTETPNSSARRNAPTVMIGSV